MKAHIKYLLKSETLMNVRFSRVSDSVICISSAGYKHNDLNTVESELLKLGCRYDFSGPTQEYDKVSGRTFTHMREPVQKGRTKIGTVLWFDDRDGHGIIVDARGNEYYVDVSVIPNRINLKRNQKVKFRKNQNIQDTLCAIVETII